MSCSENTPGRIADQAETIAAEIERLAREERLVEELPILATQRVLAAATRAYVAHRAEGTLVPPFEITPGVTPITATEAIVTASQMLQALDLEVFELALWQSQGSM